MILTQPLGFLLSFVLPLIILLHFKKKQVREYPVPSLDLWEEILREAEGVRTLRLRHYLLFFLQILMALLLTLCLVRPLFLHSPGGDRVTMALDASFTMQAREQGQSRFQEAREAALRYLRGLPEDTLVTLVLMAESCQPAARDVKKGEAASLIKGARCTGESLNLDQAAQVLPDCPGEIILFTDKDLSLGDRVVRVGGDRLDNAGIAGARFDYYTRTLLCRVRNDSPESRSVNLELLDDRGGRDLKTREIPPGEETWVTFSLPGEAELLTLKILGEDMLVEDNTFLLPVGDAGKTRVLLAAASPFLEKALASMAEIKLDQGASSEDFSGEYDLYILDHPDQAAAVPPGKGLWLLNPPGEMIEGEASSPLPLEAPSGPLNQGGDFTGVSGERLSFLKPREGFTTLLAARGKPVMFYGTEGGEKRVYSTLDFSRTNLVLRAEFPVLVHRVVEWFGEYGEPAVPNNPPEEPVTGKDPGEEKKGSRGEPVFFDPQKGLLLIVLVLFMAEGEVYRLGI